MWTGRQGKAVGLVDHLGGLSTALGIVQSLCNSTDTKNRLRSLRIEVMESKGRSFPLAFLSSATTSESSRIVQARPEVMATCDSIVFETGLVSPETIACGSSFLKNLGLPASLRYELDMGSLRGLGDCIEELNAEPSMNFLSQLFAMLVSALG